VAKLNIIRASAGSGKTYTLTEEYLKLAFRDPDSFRNILAVTFTNKATAEMKTRIINELHRLSTGEQSKHLNLLIQELKVPESTLRSKADIILQKILHNYSRFAISTIDSFFQYIIRSFTREIGIQSGYSIELDTEPILDELIDRLQTETTTNKTLLRWLTDFALDKIENGNTWDFRKDITNLGKQLFSERFKSFSHTISVKLADKVFMSDYQRELYSIRRTFETKIRSLASKGMDHISSSGLSVEDFYHGNNGPAGYLQKTASGFLPEPGSRARNAAESAEGWYCKNSARKNEIENLCRNGLPAIMQELVQYYDQQIRDFTTAEQILKNLYTLGILADLSVHLQDYCDENNVFILSDASSFLNRIIDNNDTPFIYEKTGNHFHHFMIDEFQDTSILQWNNFKPLISNSLSQDYDNFIVGDVKQSIYRWRNSNWEILATDITREFYEQSLSFKTLHSNHRSCENIIQFNNTFFREASLCLQKAFNDLISNSGVVLAQKFDQSIIRNFSDALQQPGSDKKSGGRVSISFLEKEDYQAVLETRLLKLIQELLDQGYTPGDIAILTRKNEEAKNITDFLLRQKDAGTTLPHRFDIISDEALHLANSSAVRFLVALIRYFHSPEDEINKYFIVREYIVYLLPEERKNNSYSSITGNPEITDSFIADLFPSAFQNLLNSAGYLSLFELNENLIALFKLDRMEGESVYLQTFQDLVLDYSHRKSSSVADFLEFWEESGYKKSVALPGNQNAIRVLTIHKAKGLEFPVVILPYCSWSITGSSNRSAIWCIPQQPPFNRLDIVPVQHSGKLADTHFAADYFEELLKQFIDSLNLLYVAFTRAEKGLFCFSEMPGKEKLNSISGLLSGLLTKSGISTPEKPSLLFPDYYRPAELLFEYGDLPCLRADQPGNENIRGIPNHYPVYDARKHFRIASQGRAFIDPVTGEITKPVSEGSLMHEIFSGIINYADIPAVLERMNLAGKITNAEKDKLAVTIQHFFGDLQVMSWFSGDWKVLTESEFILPGGEIRRPDRLLVKGNQAVLIDFKFGKNIESSHRTQVLEYQQLLTGMGYTQSEAWLWYVTLNKVIQVTR
jgi:ATP-dependent helicase/nuclease subunit A